MHTMRLRAGITAALAAATMAGLAIPAAAGTAPPAARHLAPAPVLPLMGQQAQAMTATPARAATAAPAPVTRPLTPSQCEQEIGTPCYTGALLRSIYGLSSRNQGAGAKVALIMPFTDKAMRGDLSVFARANGLPQPDLHVYRVGNAPVADPGNPAQAAAEVEAELDAQMIDAIAPRAEIDYYELPTDFSTSPAALSEWISALDGLRGSGTDAVNLSLGWAEQAYAQQAGSTAAGSKLIRQQAEEIGAAVRSGITVVTATGDTGSAGVDLTGDGLYTTPAVLFPASSPVVVGVSGTEVYASDQGHRTQPDVAWSDPSGDGEYGATGGGLSTVFGRPSYQDPYAPVTGGHRGVGDVSMDGASQTPVWFYTSEYNAFSGVEALGWQYIAGTSASAPMFTGIAALAAAEARHPLGNVHAALYAMARHPAASGIQPVTSGCNGDYGVPGVCATDADWSMPDGIGTVGLGDLFTRTLAARASRR
jgi:subtilase family serine protease